MPAQLSHLLQASAWQRLRLVVNVRHAWRALLASPRRFVFSCASLSIGIGAMIAVLGIGQSIHAFARKQFDGPGMQVVRLSVNASKGSESSGEPLRAALDIRLLQRAIRQTGGGVSLVDLARFENCVPDPEYGAELVGLNGDLAQVIGPRVIAGRALSQFDGDANWALFGYELARAITRQKGYLPIGQTVQVCGVALRMAGVLERAPDSAYILPFNLNHSALLSRSALRRLGSGGGSDNMVSDVLLRFEHSEVMEARASQIKQVVQQDSGVELLLATPGQFLAAMRAQESALMSSLIVTGLVVLFIGAFGIMENLLSSINERRAEIGIRLSVGASPRDIHQQFAIEALMLVLAGGVAGLLLGSLAALAYAQMRQMPFVVSGSSVALALGLAALIGLASGFFPARRAAAVDPVSAILG
jgi:putative ABC transport system permease protein